MNETFRVSQTHLRRHPLWFGLVIVLVVALVAGQFWNDEAKDIASTVFFGVAVLAIATFGFARTHREMKMYAANHVLVLTDDAILLRDGATERRIPYGAIERLTIRQPLFGDRYFLVKCSGLTEDKFYGYELVERLLSAVIAKLPPDRVKGTHVHAKQAVGADRDAASLDSAARGRSTAALGVNDTFRISEGHIRRQRILFVLLTVLVLALLAARLWSEHTEGLVLPALVALVVFAIVCFSFVRVHRHTIAYAANHALLLTQDAILLRDGGTERRVPYSAIELLKIRRPYFGEPWFSLKYVGLTEDRFYGYERMDRLLLALIARLPPDRVKGNDVHA